MHQAWHYRPANWLKIPVNIYHWMSPVLHGSTEPDLKLTRGFGEVDPNVKLSIWVDTYHTCKVNSVTYCRPAVSLSKSDFRIVEAFPDPHKSYYSHPLRSDCWTQHCQSGSLLHRGPILQWSANTHTQTLIPPLGSLFMVSLPFLLQATGLKGKNKTVKSFFCGENTPHKFTASRCFSFSSGLHI